MPNSSKYINISTFSYLKAKKIVKISISIFFICNLDELLVSFSLMKNSKALFSLQRDPADISTIHGIRFLNAALLLLSHKSMALFYNPHVNRTRMVEVCFTNENN